MLGWLWVSSREILQLLYLLNVLEVDAGEKRGWGMPMQAWKPEMVDVGYRQTKVEAGGGSTGLCMTRYLRGKV